jgi:nucleotide-binding universal stress UspA family protein
MLLQMYGCGLSEINPQFQTSCTMSRRIQRRGPVYKHILIPTDGTALSRKAIKQGVRLARRLGAKVTVFIATPNFRFYTLDPMMSRDSPERYLSDCRKYAKRALDAAQKLAAAQHVRCRTQHVVADHPYKAIIGAAGRSRCDLIVMASHGRRGVSRFVLGSETNKVLSHSNIPVLVCR